MTGCERQYYVTGVSLRDPIIKDTKDFDVSHLILTLILTLTLIYRKANSQNVDFLYFGSANFYSG